MEYKTPWISICLNPRATIRSIVADNPKRCLFWLATIFGFSELMNFFQSLALGLWWSAPLILLFAILGAPLTGYALMTLWSWLVMHIGHWLKGKGDFASVRAAYAWSSVPLLGTIPIWFLIIWLFQTRLFVNFPQEPTLSLASSATLLFLLAARLILVIWALVLYFIGLSEVHRFSIIRSICTVAIAGILVSIVSGFFWYILLILLIGPT